MNVDPSTKDAAHNLATVGQAVEARSNSLKKELGLFDLVLTQVVFVVGTIWVGWAAKLGNSQMAFWLIAIITFYLPLAAVVIYLNRLAPLEGGLYQWTKVAFNDLVAFMVAWNFWIFGILVMSGIGLIIKKNIAYAIGPRANWMHENKWMTTLICLLLMMAIIAASRRGLALGKWVQNFGGAMLIITFITLILLPLITAGRGSLANYHPFSTSLPQFSIYNLNVSSKLAIGALSGFEYIAILAGECRAPARNISRSVMISAPIIALMFILGTGSVLAFVAPDKVDLIGPIPQVLSLGFNSFGWVSTLVSITIFGVAARQIALMSIYFAGNTRLPMVAGWDNLLPKWFTRLHHRHQTPVNSILFVGLVTLVFSLAALIGVKEQEAFQFQDNAANVFYALIYMVLFAIPIVAMKRFGAHAPWWLKVAAGSGFLVSVIGAFFTVFPIIEVQSRLLFAAKIIVVVIAANAIGAGLYLMSKKRAASN
ncbi:MAG: glutamate:GABA antiporter [Blastocatellia bacterium]|jgi:amino acid transporter|nr:glutamate:GABA antiporter [Blastocatellia bacterium]